MNKPCKLAATVLTIALVVFLLAGCGGEEEDTAPPPKSKTTKETSESASPGATAGELPESLIGQAVVPTKDSPTEFTDAIEDNMPIVVTIYMPGPYDDNQVRASIMTLQGRYKGRVEFLDYLYSDGRSYGDLVTLLKVNTTPTVVMINKQGQVQRAWTGYADVKSLEQGIVEITQS